MFKFWPTGRLNNQMNDITLLGGVLSTECYDSNERNFEIDQTLTISILIIITNIYNLQLFQFDDGVCLTIRI